MNPQIAALKIEALALLPIARGWAKADRQFRDAQAQLVAEDEKKAALSDSGRAARKARARRARANARRVTYDAIQDTRKVRPRSEIAYEDVVIARELDAEERRVK